MSDWIEWNGGEMPVEPGTLVDVKHRSGGFFYAEKAGSDHSEEWRHECLDGDIIAYRLHKPESKPHPHAENMALYAEDAAETDRPWERWEMRCSTGEWMGLPAVHPGWEQKREYRRKPKLTPAQEAGFEVGDLGVKVGDNEYIKSGSVVALKEDDGSNCPRWRVVDGEILSASGNCAYDFVEMIRKLHNVTEN